MSVSKQIDVLAMYYLASHQALEFILGWLTMTGIFDIEDSFFVLCCVVPFPHTFNVGKLT